MLVVWHAILGLPAQGLGIDQHSIEGLTDPASVASRPGELNHGDRSGYSSNRSGASNASKAAPDARPCWLISVRQLLDALGECDRKIKRRLIGVNTDDLQPIEIKNLTQDMMAYRSSRT